MNKHIKELNEQVKKKLNKYLNRKRKALDVPLESPESPKKKHAFNHTDPSKMQMVRPGMETDMPDQRDVKQKTCKEDYSSSHVALKNNSPQTKKYIYRNCYSKSTKSNDVLVHYSCNNDSQDKYKNMKQLSEQKLRHEIAFALKRAQRKEEIHNEHGNVPLNNEKPAIDKLVYVPAVEKTHKLHDDKTLNNANPALDASIAESSDIHEMYPPASKNRCKQSFMRVHMIEKDEQSVHASCNKHELNHVEHNNSQSKTLQRTVDHVGETKLNKKLSIVLKSAQNRESEVKFDGAEDISKTKPSATNVDNPKPYQLHVRYAPAARNVDSSKPYQLHVRYNPAAKNVDSSKPYPLMSLIKDIPTARNVDSSRPYPVSLVKHIFLNKLSDNLAMEPVHRSTDTEPQCHVTPSEHSSVDMKPVKDVVKDHCHVDKQIVYHPDVDIKPDYMGHSGGYMKSSVERIDHSGSDVDIKPDKNLLDRQMQLCQPNGDFVSDNIGHSSDYDVDMDHQCQITPSEHSNVDMLPLKDIVKDNCHVDKQLVDHPYVDIKPDKNILDKQIRLCQPNANCDFVSDKVGHSGGGYTCMNSSEELIGHSRSDVDIKPDRKLMDMHLQFI